MSENLDRAWGYARAFCETHPGWKTIDQVPESELLGLYLSFEELPAWERKFWRRKYHRGAKEAWEMFAIKPLRVNYLFAAEDGVLYSSVAVMPGKLNFVMILNMGGVVHG